MPSLTSLHTNHGATRMLFTNHPLLRGVYLNLVVLSLMLGSSLTLAHHGIATKFDPAKTLTVKGRVARRLVLSACAYLPAGNRWHGGIALVYRT